MRKENLKSFSSRVFINYFLSKRIFYFRTCMYNEPEYLYVLCTTILPRIWQNAWDLDWVGANKYVQIEMGSSPVWGDL